MGYTAHCSCATMSTAHSWRGREGRGGEGKRNASLGSSVTLSVVTVFHCSDNNAYLEA